MNTRAQVTTFIIVGLVLVGVAGILVSLSSSLKTETLTQAKPQDDRARFDVAVKIIRDCITRSTQHSIFEIAQQGGALFDEQGGPDMSSLAIPTVVDSTRTVFVAKGIVRRTDEPGYPTQIQFAPGLVRSAPVDPTQNQLIKKLGGSVAIPKLCDRFGPNMPNNTNVLFTCEIASYGYDGKTIQNKIAQAVKKETIACAQNSSALFTQLGNDVSVYFGQVPAVVFGDNDVTVSYSFDTNVSTKRSNFSYHDTSVQLPVRLKRLYNFLYAVLDEDSKNVLFDKTRDYPNVNTCNYPDSSACWLDGFSISVVYGAFVSVDNKVFDLVTATDSKSLIGGKPLELRTVVENRRPVLMPIYDIFSFPQSTTHPLLDWKQRYDLYVKNGNTVLLKPFAYDFDEEEGLRYSYSGWKSTTDSKFRTGTFENPNEGCSAFDPLRCEYWNDAFLDDVSAVSSQNYWETSPQSAYVTGVGCDGDLSRCASYKTNTVDDEGGDDLGPHSVRITATDRGGLSDYVQAAVLVGTD